MKPRRPFRESHKPVPAVAEMAAECRCASCEARWQASRQPKVYPAWVTAPGWGAWDGTRYAENRPARPSQTAQEALAL